MLLLVKDIHTDAGKSLPLWAAKLQRAQFERCGRAGQTWRQAGRTGQGTERGAGRGPGRGKGTVAGSNDCGGIRWRMSLAKIENVVGCCKVASIPPPPPPP